MNLCLPYTPCLVHPLWIVTWKVGWPCVSLHVCPSHLIFVPTPCLECVHAWVHEFMSSWLLMCSPPLMHSLMEAWVPLYGSVFVSHSSHFFCYTLFRMCTCISTWIYVYLTPHVWSHPLWIVTWKVGCPCVSLCLCPNQSGWGPIPCLECVHASVHEFISNLHPMSGPTPMDIYMESWVALCVTACVSQSPYFCSYTLFRMCTCIITWIYVQLAAYVWSTPYA